MKKAIAIIVGLIILGVLSAFYFPFVKKDAAQIPAPETLTAEKRATTIAVSLYLREGGKGNASIDCLVHDQPIILTATSTNNECPFLRTTVSDVLGNKESVDMTKLERLMRIDAFYENDIPIRKYLYENHGTTSPEYALLYEDVILARNIGMGTIANQPKSDTVDEVRSLSRQYFITAGNEADQVYRFDRESLSKDLDALIYTDVSRSGAYNFFSIVYTADFSSGEMVLRAPEVVAEHEHTLVRYQNNFTNIGFNEDKTLGESGMRAFGLYPCNHEMSYIIKTDRLILEKEEAKKVCDGVDIEVPADLSKIPDDADFTKMINVYRIAPALLQKALTAALSSFSTYIP